ncbi:MAG: septum formation initiator family protein [Akkermansia sp.]|nr:septum formation initiator family protein [Akkermansia sp.]
MFDFFKLRRMPTLEEIERDRERRSRGIRSMLKVAGIIFLALVAFISSMLLLNPMLQLHSLEQEKARAEQQLKKARLVEDEAYHRFLWMDDPEYFEQIARDRANQAKAGEHIVRRPTAEELKQMEQEKRKQQKPKKRRRD